MSKERRKLYVAYGSNLDRQQMAFRCPTATVVGTGTIKDYRLMFKGSKTGSYLTIEPAPGFEVPVAVWSVTAHDEMRLDIYEGFPQFYYKADVRLPVHYSESDKVVMKNAFVYIMHEDHHLGRPSKSYMDVCTNGYEDFGFDLQVLREAYKFSIGEVK